MKLHICTLALFAVAISAAAQQPNTPPQTPAQAELEKRAELLQSQGQLLYEKLHGLTEFQQYIKVQQELSDLQRQYQASLAPPAKAPVATPPKQQAPPEPAAAAPKK